MYEARQSGAVSSAAFPLLCRRPLATLDPVQGVTVIPLSNLVEIHEKWWKMTRDRDIESPIGKTLYEYIRVHGDEVERGEMPDFV